MRVSRLIAICLVAGAFAQHASRADVINPADIGTTFFASTPANSATVAYDATTGIFTLDQTFTASNPYVFFNSLTISPATTVADDFLGTFTLSAMIDNSGTFSGGTFSMVGESATLGIAAGTMVLAGTLETFINGFAEGLQGVQFVSHPDTLDAALQAAVGPINTLLISQCCMPHIGFGVSFGPETTASSGPDLFGTARKNIPEPGTLVLFVVGLAGLRFLNRRRLG